MTKPRSERPPRVLLGVTGGVAAVKAPSLVRRLREAGAEVRVATSPDADRFVTTLALATVSGHEVLDRATWFRPDGEARHLSWGRWADALLVAPASAEALASAAAGRAADPLAALALVASRTVWAPAMNPAMWAAPAVRRNVATLRGDGHVVIDPEHGPLGGVDEGSGVGRLPEEPVLVRAALAAAEAGPVAPRDLTGRRVLVTAGPTREWLDPVRFLSNPSSGRMGVALAEAARDRGAEVVLVHGPLTVPLPVGVRAVAVESAEEMMAAVRDAFRDCELLLMAAAVADWRPRERAGEKEPKRGDAKTIELVRTPDVLATLARDAGSRVLVGFAMETDAGVERAARKAREKGLAFIALNYPARAESAFGGAYNRVTLVTAAGEAEELPRMRKRDVADRILDRAAPRLP